MGDATCSIDGCGGKARARGWCRTHYDRWWVHGDPLTVHSTAGPRNGRWRGDQISYRAMHDRVRRLRGRAGDRKCEHCGGRADQWAYDHADPDEKTCERETRSGIRQLAYSTDPNHYLALCDRCHRVFDAGKSSRHNASKTHCPQGHPYDEANTSYSQRSPTRRSRHCRKCKAARERARKQAQRSAKA